MTWGASEVDFDRDGRYDLWIGRHFHGSHLWRNTGRGRYARVKTTAWPRYSTEGLLVDRHDCQWADVDRNGRPDAYCSAGRFNANFVKTGRDNELWLQGPVGVFRDVGTEWRVGDKCARGRTVLFLHANADRFPDLFVGNAIPRTVPDPCNRYPERFPNEDSKLFINVAGERFKYAKRKFDYGPGPGARCSVEIDFDRDGWPDILACGGISRTVATLRSGAATVQDLRLFRNRSGHGFVDVSSRLPSVLVHDAVTGDIDDDRDPDVIFANNAGFYYSLNDDGQFDDPVRIADIETGRGRAVAVGDADLDGDLDVFGMIGRRFHRNPDDRLYLNDGLEFTSLVVPRALGTADEVIAVRPIAGRPAQFLVLNGYHVTEDPNLQLIRLAG